VRSELREALLHGQLARGHVSLVLTGASRRSELAASKMERALRPHRFIETEMVPGAAAARSMAQAKANVRKTSGTAGGGGLPSDEVIELGRARVSLLELVAPVTADGKQPRYEEREVQEAWLPLASARGETVGQVLTLTSTP